jgi:hypothetical protein
MKTGLIIYATGDPPRNWTETDSDVTGKIGWKPEMVKIITRTSGHFDIHDAWFELVSKGMAHIVCKMASFNDLGEMVLTGREFRLCG